MIYFLYGVFIENLDLILCNFVHRAFNGDISQTVQLGVTYVATNALKNGYKAKIFHGDNIFDQLIESVSNSNSLIIGFYCNSDNIKAVLRTAFKIKNFYKFAKVILGGPLATQDYKALIQNEYIDYVCRGDGEELIVEILNGVPLDDILGLSYKTSNGEVVHNSSRPTEKDLDKYPMPDRLIYPIENTYEKMIISTSRGCGFRCTFCFESIQRQIRFHSIERVMSEVSYVLSTFRHKYFSFSDDIFTTHKERLLEICSKLKDRYTPFKDMFWYCEARVDSLAKNPILLKSMKEAGLARVQIGTESGDQRVIDSYQKKISISEIYETVRQIEENQIQSCFTNFILGGPFESEETFKKTESMIIDLYKLAPGRFECSCNFLSPYPGTDIYNNPSKYDLKILDTDFYTDLSGNYVCTETKDLSRWDIINLYNRLNSTIANTMLEIAPTIPFDLIRTHLIRSYDGLNTQWAALFIKDQIHSNWVKFIVEKSYSQFCNDIDTGLVYPTRTFHMTHLVGNILKWPLMNKYLEFGKQEFAILELLAGKLSIYEISRYVFTEIWESKVSLDVVLKDVVNFIENLAEMNLVVFRIESEKT